MNLRLRIALGAAALAAYAALGHQLMTRAPGSPWSVAVMVGPMVLLTLAGVWRSGQRALATGLGLAALAVAAWALQGGSLTPNTLYLLQHAGVHAGLGLWFGSTLRAGSVPLITQLAGRLHPLTPEMQGYTRRVTAVWAVYFAIMLALSLGLYAWAPFAAWSLFANLLTPLAMAALFIGEFLLRYRLHPEFTRTGMVASIGAWLQSPPDAQ